MALVTLNGQDVIELSLRMPRSGVWHADLLVGDNQALAGPVTVDVSSGALVLQGSVQRSGVFVDADSVRVLAGAGGLGTTAPPKHYVGTSVRVVLGELLAAAGERLSPTADAGILATGLDAFTVTAIPVKTAITLLVAAAAPGAVWRMLPDGTLWLGRETWPDAGVDPATYQILEQASERREMLIAVDAPLALVGTTFEGKRVSRTLAIVDQIKSAEGLSMRLWFEDEGDAPAVDRFQANIARLVDKATARTDRIDYGRHYPARVIAQSGATVHVQPDQVGGKDLLPDMGEVPLLLGLPGASVQLEAAGRVMIGWLGADPSKPYAVAFDGETIAKTIVLAVNQKRGLALGGDDGASAPPLGDPLIDYLTRMAAAINAIVPFSIEPPNPLDLLAQKVTVA